jgi:hypothetical protein
MWNYHSVMFEVVMCITLYTTVLLFEFAPAFLERVKWKNALTILKKFTYPLVIAGIVLSFLPVVARRLPYRPAKLSHLVHANLLPLLPFGHAGLDGLLRDHHRLTTLRRESGWTSP